MRAGIVSVLLLALAIVMLFAAGLADWSETFALTWNTVFGGAVLSALVALISALVHRDATVERRVAAVTLALPALLALAGLIWLIATLAKLAD